MNLSIRYGVVFALLGLCVGIVGNGALLLFDWDAMWIVYADRGITSFASFLVALGVCLAFTPVVAAPVQAYRQIFSQPNIHPDA